MLKKMLVSWLLSKVDFDDLLNRYIRDAIDYLEEGEVIEFNITAGNPEQWLVHFRNGEEVSDDRTFFSLIKEVAGRANGQGHVSLLGGGLVGTGKVKMARSDD